MRRLKAPRLYTLDFDVEVWKQGKTVMVHMSKMLGVAFNNVQQQKFFYERRRFESYRNLKNVKLHSERLVPGCCYDVVRQKL